MSLSCRAFLLGWIVSKKYVRGFVYPGCSNLTREDIYCREHKRKQQQQYDQQRESTKWSGPISLCVNRCRRRMGILAQDRAWLGKQGGGESVES